MSNALNCPQHVLRLRRGRCKQMLYKKEVRTGTSDESHVPLSMATNEADMSESHTYEVLAFTARVASLMRAQP